MASHFLFTVLLEVRSQEIVIQNHMRRSTPVALPLKRL